MEWTDGAEAAIKKVPFFVRKRVRAHVEKEAAAEGKKSVTISEVNTSRKRFLTNMESEIKGYKIDICFGPGGCPNRAAEGGGLLRKIENLLKNNDLLSFLKERIKCEIKFHHEFRVTIADCPNACSQPQIKDVGIMGACIPIITDEECTICQECVNSCKEKAVTINSDKNIPEIDYKLCLKCGQCVTACPTGTIAEGEKGYRVQLGGKLGRHPKLAKELPGIYGEDEVIEIVKYCIAFYKKNSRKGERFAEIFKDTDFSELASIYGKDR